MKFNKGMWLEGNPNNQPQDTTRINNNIVIRRGSGDIIPEPGFVLHNNGYNTSLGIKRTPIGEIILFDDDFVIFSINALGGSEIGINTNGVYTLLINDVDLKFDENYPIHGVAYKNYKGERIIVFTDNVNPVRILNIDNIADYNNVDKMLLFRLAIQPDIDIDLVDYVGTGLKTGAYYPICQYELSDFSTTDWFLGYNPVYITDSIDNQRYIKYDGNISGINSDKAIILNMKRINSDFNKINIGYVQVKDGELFAYKLNSLIIKDTIFNNSEIKTIISEDITKETLSIQEIQKIRSKFKNVKLIEQFQNSLILTDVKNYKEKNQQRKVNALELNCHSKLSKIIDYDVLGGFLNLNNLKSGYKTHEYNNEQRTFCHGEVYAFYIQFEFKWGFGQWWTLIGNTLTEQDREIDTRFESKFKKYQIDDTCQVISQAQDGFFIAFSKWENEDEDYPKNGNYPIGKVRHFKFPSMQYLRKYVHDDSRMGTTHQSVLGVKLRTINLDDFKDEQGNSAISFRIGYAKRDNLNSSTLGQSIAIVNQYYDDDRPFIGNGESNYTRRFFASAGGNYKYITGTNVLEFTEFDGTDKSNLRIYPVELLVTKNNPIFNYIRKEYELRSTVPFKLSKLGQIKQTTIKDYTTGTSSKVGENDKMFSVINKKYIPANVILNDYDNLLQEEHLNINVDNADNLMKFNAVTDQWSSPEYNVIITLLNVKKNYYNSFYQQQVVNCGVIKSNANDIIYGGDMYHCDMNVNVYGRFTKGTTTDVDGTAEKDAEHADLDHKYSGVRSAKRFLISSFYNMNFKFVIDDKTKGYTDYYPVSGHDYLWTMERDKNANDWINGYNRDYNVLNDLEYSDIYNPMIFKQSVFPYRIYKSENLSKSSLVNYWRIILSENYYEMPNNRGSIVNLVAGQDYIFIHHEKSLFKTRNRQKLQTTEGTEVLIGVGDIFEQNPIEVLHDQYGMLGTQHKYSCRLTPYGYIFCDAEKHKWFLINESVKDISNLQNGSELFFYNNSEMIGDNPYIYNGYTVAVDEKHKRLIITRKAKLLKQEYRNKYKGIYQDTPAFISTLKQGDIVFKDNSFQEVK